MTHFLRFFILFAASALASAGASANSLVAQCSTSAGKEIDCRLRLTEPGKIDKVGIVVGGKPLDKVSYTAHADARRSAAWYFLIDRSDKKRAATVGKVKTLVSDFAAKASAERKFGVASFANELQEILPLGGSTEGLADKLKDIRADGLATEFYFAAIQAIRSLDGYNADRKALVIISDGKAEDKAYNQSDVVAEARKGGVVIYGIGYAEKQTETPHLQVLQRLSEETNGPFAAADTDGKLPDGFVNDFFAYIENGGTAKAPLAGNEGTLPVKIDVDLADGTHLDQSTSLFVAADDTGFFTSATLVKAMRAISPGAGDWAAANTMLAVGLFSFLMLTVLALLGWLFWRLLGFGGKKVEPLSEPATMALQDPQPAPAPLLPEPLGWFEMLDDQSNRYDIRQRVVRIGRHSDNDYRLNNDTVHRHHAQLEYTDDVQPILVDLDTVNGIVVNGKRVEKAVLSPGDLIELGEVRFRYFARD